MTNDRIQQVLAMAGGLTASDARSLARYVSAASSLLRALAVPGGAIAIADQAAWELICSECRCFHDEPDDVAWYEIAPGSLPLVRDEEDLEVHVRLVESINYLSARGLLTQHPKHSSLVTLAMTKMAQANTLVQTV